MFGKMCQRNSRIRKLAEPGGRQVDDRKTSTHLWKVTRGKKINGLLYGPAAWNTRWRGERSGGCEWFLLLAG